MINVILAATSRIGGYLFGFMSIARPGTDDSVPESKCGRLEVQPTSSFSDEDKARTFQPHNDALVVTL